MIVPQRRRRWRTALLVMHAILIPLAFILFFLLIIPVIYNSSSTDYYILIVIVFIVGLYAILGLLVFWIFKYLLRVLCIIAACLLMVISMFFIISYFMSIHCSYKLETNTNVTIKSNDCQKAERKNGYILFHNCSTVHLCASDCLPFPLFWSNISQEKHIYIRALVLPVSLLIAAYTIFVLILTIWRGVNEMRFEKDICLFGMGHGAVHSPHLAPPLVYSAATRTPKKANPTEKIVNENKEELEPKKNENKDTNKGKVIEI